MATWVGWSFVIVGIWNGVKLITAGSMLKDQFASRLWRYLLIGGALLLISIVIPAEYREGVSGVRLPVIWPYTHLSGWLILMCAIGSVTRGYKLLTAHPRSEAKQHLAPFFIWLGSLGVSIWWSISEGNQFWILKGSIPINIPTVAGLAALAIAGMFLTTRLEASLKAKGIGRGVITHLVLLIGSIVFGIPLLWMLSTSFKEDEDLANSNGLVWVPKVQRSHDYWSKDNPLYTTWHEGRKVRGIIDSEASPTEVLLEIERPYSFRGRRIVVQRSELTEVPRQQPIFSSQINGEEVIVFVTENLPNGDRKLEVLEPSSLKGTVIQRSPEEVKSVRDTGLKIQNYSDALEWMPPETYFGSRYLINTIWLVVMSVIGTVLSCSIVAYGFARLRFPGREALFGIMLATMMLPAAVTMLPQFLIFRSLGWIDTLLPLWVPTFFASAFNVFLLRQFFATVPKEYEESARIDGCGYWRTFWQVMLPQVKAALAVIAIWTFMGAWNNFMGPLIYLTSPEKMTLSYALHLFAGDRGTEPALMMSFATMTIVPVVLLFFFAQKYFMDSIQLTGLGGR